MSARRQFTAPRTPNVGSIADSASEFNAESHTHLESSKREKHKRHDSVIPFPSVPDVADHGHAVAQPDDEVRDESEEEEEKRIHQLRLKRATTFSKDYTDEEERAVVGKLDRKLVLFLAFLYLLSFLDRSNIGNARLAGLEANLKMSDKDFDYCLLAFYITYIAFEWMILLYRIVPPRVYISACVLGWGLIASLQSAVPSFRYLLALRALLGICEASFGPGVPFYMTFFYNRTELAYRVGLQISAAPLATSFASTLAWIIVKLSAKTPLEPWRALFLFEGFPSIIAAVFAWYIIPNSPETARYLSSRERKVAQLRLREEKKYETHSHGLMSNAKNKSPWHRLLNSVTAQVLCSPLPWLQSLIFFSINVSFASLPVFLPTIINSMGVPALMSQILSAPPYLLSFGFVLLVGHLSDKMVDSRHAFLIACSCLSAVSYFVIGLCRFGQSEQDASNRSSQIIRYIAVCTAAMGLFSSVVLIITWNLNNQPSRKEKGLAMMIMNVVGQCGPLVGVQLFPRSDGPLYTRGMVVCGLFMTVVACLAALLRWQLGRMNAQLSSAARGYELVSLRETQTEGVDHDGVETVVAGKIDRGFRYML